LDFKLTHHPPLGWLDGGGRARGQRGRPIDPHRRQLDSGRPIQMPAKRANGGIKKKKAPARLILVRTLT
jgi:hypothetical protein